MREDFVGVGAGVDGEVEGGDGEVAGEIGDGGDLGVGDEVEGAVAVAQGGEAEGEVFDGAGERGELDDVADVVLVFDEDEDAVEMSLKRDCAPRPMPTPTTPAEASRG